MRDITLGDTLYHMFTTRAFASGVPTTLSGTPVLSVLEENNATPITSGVSVQVDRASVTGLNQATIVATSGNGYETGKTYAIYISTGTVGGVSVVGEVVGMFTIEKSAAFIRLGAPAGASVSADILAIDNFVDGLETTIGAAGAGLTAVAGIVWNEDATAHQTLGTFGQAIGDPAADTNTIYKAVVTDAAGATVGVDVVAVKAETASIQADTDNIQTRLPDALVGGRIDASIGAVASGAITAAGFAAGAIDAAAIAPDAIGASELAADAANEIADALLARNVAGGSSAGRLVKESLYVLRNKTAIAAGTLTVFGTDDVTPAFTAAVTTAAGNPIDSIDPA